MCNGIQSLSGIVSCLVVIQAYADTKTWTGGAGNALFSSASNWNPAGAPASGDALAFANSSALYVTNDLADYTFSGITVSGSTTVTFQSGGSGLSEYVRPLTIGGTKQPIGTYGSINSIAQYKSTFFAGNGILNVMRSEIPTTLLLVR